MPNIGPIALPECPLLLAPMEDVSDPPFRELCKEQGADGLFTEFISSEGLIRDAAGSIQKLDFFEHERPLGIQIFGAERDAMIEATKIAAQAGPDLIDINFGCPVKKVTCKGAGAAILREPEKMQQLTREVVEATDLPVTVKTRLGWDHDSIWIVDVAQRLQEAGIQALSIHGRTRKQMYKGEADWSWIQAVKEHPAIEIPIFGNGDIDTPQRAWDYWQRYGVDGLMVGRATIGNPWFFREVKHYFRTGELLAGPTLEERARVARQHLERSIAWKGHHTGIVEMRRHYAPYFKGIPNFKPIRTRLVTSDDLGELHDILNGLEAGEFERLLPAKEPPREGQAA
jgi:nifR3 family TIM-barrel protein